MRSSAPVNTISSTVPCGEIAASRASRASAPARLLRAAARPRLRARGRPTPFGACELTGRCRSGCRCAVWRREQQVRRAEEGGDEARRRARVQLVRPADLEQAAEIHHADAIGEREGFFLVVRDQHGGDAELALHLADRAPQLLADLRVERAEGLIEQQHFGLVRERARHGDALLLAAGKLRGQALVHAFERHEPQQLLAALRRGPRASCAARAGRIRCCPPRSCGGTARSSGTRARRRARARTMCVTSRPCSAMRPWSTPVRPAMARSSVLLPLPLGPSSTKNSPSPMSTETSLTTGTP